jgi:hypothetical protein
MTMATTVTTTAINKVPTKKKTVTVPAKKVKSRKTGGKKVPKVIIKKMQVKK